MNRPDLEIVGEASAMKRAEVQRNANGGEFRQRLVPSRFEGVGHLSSLSSVIAHTTMADGRSVSSRAAGSPATPQEQEAA